MRTTHSATGFARTALGDSNESRSSWYRLSIAAAAAGLLMCVAHATAAELPTYEVTGFAITPHQLAQLAQNRTLAISKSMP